MARPRKYEDAEKLRRAVEKYFNSITREREMTEKRDTGMRDDKGHVIYEDVVVLNKLGKPLKVTDYIVPPTVGDLCDALGITRETWREYCDREKHPEFSDTTTRARGRMMSWNERELLTREGKDCKGIIFNLENNYGYREQQSIDVHGSLENYLAQAAESGQVQEF